MKTHSSIFVLLLALLMQVRVAYACENGAPWMAADCETHSLALDAHAGEPSDRGERCDTGIDLALRNARAADSLCDLLSEPRDTGTSGGDLPVFLPASIVLAGLEPSVATGAVPEIRVSAATAGTRLWLETARLRL